jgi:hypothetical protein
LGRDREVEADVDGVLHHPGFGVHDVLHINFIKIYQIFNQILFYFNINLLFYLIKSIRLIFHKRFYVPGEDLPHHQLVATSVRSPSRERRCPPYYLYIIFLFVVFRIINIYNIIYTIIYLL